MCRHLGITKTFSFVAGTHVRKKLLQRDPARFHNGFQTVGDVTVCGVIGCNSSYEYIYNPKFRKKKTAGPLQVKKNDSMK